MPAALISKPFRKMFGTRNDRMVKQYRHREDEINVFEPQMRQKTDAELRQLTTEFRQRIQAGERIGDLMAEVLACAREAMDRSVGIRKIFNPEMNFDVTRLPESLRGTYQTLRDKADAMEPIAELGCEDALLPGWMQIEIPNVIYDAVREIEPRSRPPFRARPFDVQLIGGMVLGEGRIAEMKTGEGKTIVAPLACYVACIESLQCHVVTVNDYLVQRDRDWVFPFYYWLGLTVGAIHPFHMQPPQRKADAYKCDVVYGTNSEFGFDYLRDNMKLSAADQVQKRRDFCIIDEVDSILIDEARTPLIISGPAHEAAPRYAMADQVAAHLIEKQKPWSQADRRVNDAEIRIKGLEGDIRNARDKAQIATMKEKMQTLLAELPELDAARDQQTQYYEVEMDRKAAHLTHDGVAEAQRAAGIGSFYVGENIDVPHLLENALRAHAVYKRDKEYVVKDGEVVIVDENTGRLMVGRQWSDGLHQAIETKERVKIKEETQTLATVTIQNFFKLYKRLAGMTGTALTEAQEFNDIYKLDVVAIPTNVPVVRGDYNDLIYLSQKDKWSAILDEIKRQHDIGRPVLVGTTSVERSEMLADLLKKKYAIPHSVLNAKQHEREAHIVADAGQLGAVMIATNMAGRGTDIRLQPIDREALVTHWQTRGLLPRDVRASMDDDAILQLANVHMATQYLGLKRKDADDMDSSELNLTLLRHWVKEEGWKVLWAPSPWWKQMLTGRVVKMPPWHDEEYVDQMSAEECRDVLDRAPQFYLHRLKIYKNIEEMGGLHIVGTERHESRRIDNQLRGRAGRQGDNGSSRFFIALDDELMAMFAKGWLLKALPRLGMKEGDALEHGMVTKAVEKAQRKVEERNYQVRKSLLEWDEAPEVQRNAFYGIRQDVLEGKEIPQIVLEYIDDAIDDAVNRRMAKDFRSMQVAEWSLSTHGISVDPARMPMDDLHDLERAIRRDARDDARAAVDVTVGEYMSDDMLPDDWDVKSLSGWAKSTYQVDLSPTQLRSMNPLEVREKITEGAFARVDAIDLSGAAVYLDPLYPHKNLAEWMRSEFDIEVDAEKLHEVDEPQQVIESLGTTTRERYREREAAMPVDFAFDIVTKSEDPQFAAEHILRFAKQRYELDWTPELIVTMTRGDAHDQLLAASKKWLHEGELERVVDEAIRQHSGNTEEIAAWASQRFGAELKPETLAEAKSVDTAVKRFGRDALRVEMTRLEQFVLLQVLDGSWKDHLYAMDQLKDSVGLRGYAEKDPKIEYKREGSRMFEEMRRTVRDRVAELIFRARLTAEVSSRNVWSDQEARHEEAAPVRSPAPQPEPTTPAGTESQQRDLAAAEQAGSGSDDDASGHLSRRQRRARQNKSDSDGGSGSGGASRQQRRRRRR